MNVSVSASADRELRVTGKVRLKEGPAVEQHREGRESAAQRAREPAVRVQLSTSVTSLNGSVVAHHEVHRTAPMRPTKI